ncbi:hypothetical protein WOLCODRAFT_139625 [Wolfiporia cocos MD-104 SS10]|uniref:PinX1-related protein 1 n=1 Tax=Wolfiporia cocos (strain MD-104) TaxID=742152 RepID=A0A2H3IY04_WOLCO|nr:hypothetical protein WOLCODRAFT_139625 [Wolfiporia cocos MD-104 SS10]
MGLSGRKVKQRIPADPRNLSWANDANRFGSSYLQKFGWDSSAGLGPSGEGHTRHISVHQKLDMLGIGADHRNSQDGTAWKQGRDFENLLRRLNASAGQESVEEPEMKVDGFVRPSDAPEGEGEASKEEEEADEGKKKRKNKKRKHGEGDEGKQRQDETKEKKRKKDKGESEDSEKKRMGQEHKKEKKEKKGKKRELSQEKDESATDGLLSSSSVPATDATPIKNVLVVPRPHRAHRARHIASKGLASKSPTAISEILGMSSSATPAVASTSASALPSTPDESMGGTPATDLRLQDLTISSKSVMDYFREKLNEKSNRSSAQPSASASPSGEQDDHDDRPRGGLGLGASRLRVSVSAADDDDERPRGGLGASSLRVAVSRQDEWDDLPAAGIGAARVRLETQFVTAEAGAPSAVERQGDAEANEDSRRIKRRKGEKKEKKEKKRKRKDVAHETDGDVDGPPATAEAPSDEAKAMKKAKQKKGSNIDADDVTDTAGASVGEAATDASAHQGQDSAGAPSADSSGGNSHRSKSKRKKDRA